MTGLSVTIAVSLLAVYLLKMAFIGVTKVTVFRNTMVLRGKKLFDFLAELLLRRTQASWAFVVESRVLARGVK